MASPPTIAPGMLPKPPRIAAANPLMPSEPPRVGLTYSSGPTSPPASAASPAPMANAIALLRPTWMPTAVAASWSMATACIAAPRLVRCRNRTSAAVATAAMPSTTRL